jgi:hypothetical protein
VPSAKTNMSRTAEHEEAVNADSFLDIVASVVSVMIIMVMMTGLKIKNTPPDAAVSADVVRAAGDLAQKTNDEQALHREIAALDRQMRELQAQTALRARERDVLSLAVTGLDQQLRGAQQQAAEQKDVSGQIAAKLAEARNRLEILNRQREAIERSPLASVQIESYNTPLGHTVVGREVHFQLKYGRVSYVPLMELVDSAVEDIKRRGLRVSEDEELSNTVKEIDGFRMTYHIRVRQPTAVEAEEQHSKKLIIEDRFVLRPVADNLGETIDEALRPGSQFRDAINSRRARDATITLWTYPGSFDEFRRLKKELYQLGFSVAARPLPEGVPISGSSSGSKSTAE